MELHFILAVWFPVSVSHKYPFHRVGVPSLIWFSICMWMRFSRLDTTAGDTYLIRSLHRQSWWLRVWLPFLYTCSLILLLLFWLKFQARQSLSGPQTSCSASRTKPLHHPWVEASTDPVNEAAPISSVLIGEKAQLQKSCRNQRPGNDVCCQGLHIIQQVYTFWAPSPISPILHPPLCSEFYSFGFYCISLSQYDLFHLA